MTTKPTLDDSTSSTNGDAAPSVVPDTHAFDAVLQQVRDVVAAQGSGPERTPDERERLRERVRGCPEEVIQRVALLASRNDGTVLGASYDPEKARAVAAWRHSARYIASELHHFARQIEDTADGELADLSDETMAILSLMWRSRRTPEGKALQSTYKELRALASPRKRSRTPKPTDPSTSGTPPTGS